MSNHPNPDEATQDLKLYPYKGYGPLHAVFYLGEDSVARPYTTDLVKDGPIEPSRLVLLRRREADKGWFEHVPHRAVDCLPFILKSAHTQGMTIEALTKRLADELQGIPSGGGGNVYGVRVRAENAALIVAEMAKR